MKYQRVSLIIATFFIASCAISPDYKKPTLQTPASYKEAANFDGWKVSEPKENQTGGSWWSIYEDTQLSILIDEATKANYSIAQAESHYRQAESLSRVARAGLFPSLSGNASAKRSQTGKADAQNTYEMGVSTV